MGFDRPGMGTDVILEIQRRFPEVIEFVPIVFLTAADSIPESRAAGRIRKPVSLNWLLEGISAYL